MGGMTQAGPQQNTNQNQSSNSSSSTANNMTSGPWDASLPALQGILSNLNAASPSPTDAQNSALGLLGQNASAIPNFGPQAAGALGNLFGSSTTGAQQLINANTGYLSNNLTAAMGANSPYLSKDFTNPYSNPAISGAMDTLKEDIGNSINGQWAASGRSGSPGMAQALARGESQGLGGLLMDQYNKNVGAQQNAINTLGNLSGQLFQGGTSGAMNSAALAQMPLQNAVTGIGALSALPGIFTQPGSTALSAANTAYGLPLQNLAGIAGLATPIASLGKTQSGTSTGTNTSVGTGSGTSVNSLPTWQVGLGALSSLFGLMA